MSSMDKNISPAVIKRLPRYYRYLGALKAKNITRISSKELSERMKVTASQIRQDLNNFGGFGQQGYGYNVENLYVEIGKILGLDKSNQMIIVGAGNLGQALANYQDFNNNSIGFQVIALFDVNPKLIGITVHGVEVHDIDDMEEFIKNHEIKIAAPHASAGPGAEDCQRSCVVGHQRILELCPCGSHAAGQCDRGECPFGRKPHDADLQYSQQGRQRRRGVKTGGTP